MKQVLIKKGSAIVETVPAPLIAPKNVLVEVAYSLISAGTERTGVQQSSKSLARQALEQPEKVTKLVNYFRQHGLEKTVARVQGQLSSGNPVGYSCSGIVIQVGENVTGFAPGQEVACAGAGKANHAEVVLVPQNLVVAVPEACDLKDAASVTLGAIAMQGVRRADPRLGEIVAVIGLGLIGQLTIQLLKVAGCRVVGLDLDWRRVVLAQKLGMDMGLLPSEVNVLTEINHITAGYGVDSTIITAAGKSDEIVQQAMEITRKKGRVVVVGDVGLGLKRSPFYQKELDFLISCSYGPGRYDGGYEEQGLDYPYAYVRWTENRNMAEYLRLVAEDKVNTRALIEREFDIDEADRAYEALKATDNRPLGVLLKYGHNADDLARKLDTKILLRHHKHSDKIKVAVVGAGGFARGVHLPNLQKLSKSFHLKAIVSATGSHAKAAAQQFEADYATSSYADVLADPEIDAVIICTRHHLHAEQAIAAARAGKAIFLEKPMALTQSELDSLTAVLTETQTPFMVGFNRRFSPAAQRAHEILTKRTTPMMILYRVNAGYIPPDQWVHMAEGGGRIIGEACHMFDLFQFLVGSTRAVEVTATGVSPAIEHILPSDNVTATLRYDDGSVATLLYTALGPTDLGKEYIEIYADGKALVIDDFRSLRGYGLSTKGWEAGLQDKGHLAEMQAFADYLQGKRPAPIPLDDLVETTNISFAAAGSSNHILTETEHIMTE